MRTINRKWLGSKLHPIIIKGTKKKKKKETNNPLIAARDKVTANMGEPSHTPQTYTKGEKQHADATRVKDGPSQRVQ